jgi:hypothetical protein
MIKLFRTALHIQKFCDARGWSSCVIGGVALQRWGEARVTRDVDLTILTGFGGEPEIIRALLEAYEPRVPDAYEFALRRRVLLLQRQEVGIDISLGGLPYEGLVVQRATLFTFPPKLPIRTCSAEDLIVLKLFASRLIDIHDAESVVARQQRLDWKYIEEQLRPLAEIKEAPEILETLERLKRGAGPAGLLRR